MIEFTPPEKSYLGYIFDCDGTLADSMPLHMDAWNHGLATVRAPFQLDGKAFMSVAGMALLETVSHWNKLHSAKIDPNDIIIAKNNFFEAHQPEIKPIESVTEFAKKCGSMGKGISVASGGTRDDVVKTLGYIGIGDLFEIIVTADDVKQSKPAPDLFLLASEKMGIAPSDCLVIEDSLLGVEAAEKAGMDSVLVPHRW